MDQRRAVFALCVTYDTPVETLKRIPSMVTEIIEAQPQVEFDRVHLKNLGDSAIEFEAVYRMVEPDYNLFMDTQQAINLAVLERFAAEGIEIAYPTQTVICLLYTSDAADE